MRSLPEVVISEFKVFNESSNNSEKKIHISYGIDENYLYGVGVSITSIILNNPNNVSFHIICDNYPSLFINKIEKLALQYKVTISLYIINVECLDILPSTKIWSRAMYFRWFAFDYFSNRLDRLLYLDADVVCKGSIQELLSIDLDHKVAAVVKDVESIQKDVRNRLPAYEMHGGYFNSGVVYMNLNQWMSQGLTKKAILLLTDKEDGKQYFKYPDQDVLNILLIDKVVFLPNTFNTIYTLKSELKDKTHCIYKKTITQETKLIHYTGATKPWHVWANYPSVSYFKDALIKSPWKDSPAKTASSMVEYKKQYKHLLVQRKYLKGIICAIVYSYRKKFLK